MRLQVPCPDCSDKPLPFREGWREWAGQPTETRESFAEMFRKHGPPLEECSTCHGERVIRVRE